MGAGSLNNHLPKCMVSALPIELSIFPAFNQLFLKTMDCLNKSNFVETNTINMFLKLFRRYVFFKLLLVFYLAHRNGSLSSQFLNLFVAGMIPNSCIQFARDTDFNIYFKNNILFS